MQNPQDAIAAAEALFSKAPAPPESDPNAPVRRRVANRVTKPTAIPAPVEASAAPSIKAQFTRPRRARVAPQPAQVQVPVALELVPEPEPTPASPQAWQVLTDGSRDFVVLACDVAEATAAAAGHLPPAVRMVGIERLPEVL
ncbi:MAG: hypothetical protein GY898_03450 [Proteobacteria bacterium]|nr:hypothetical protein [Pseudomonadota bacterium]